MDSNTARGEAIAFFTGRSQAITYQIGKLQTDLRLVYFETDYFILADVTTTGCRGETVTPAEIRARHDFIEQSRPEWIYDRANDSGRSSTK